MLRTKITLIGGICASLFAVTASSQTTKGPSDNEFVNATAQAYQYEIQAGRLMAAQSENTRVRTFAEEMIADHMKSNNVLREATIAAGLMPPSKSLGGDQQRMLNALQSLKGPELDRAYLVQQILTHTAALVVERSYAASGSDSGLCDVASDAVPLIQHHLEMAEELKTAIDND